MSQCALYVSIYTVSYGKPLNFILLYYRSWSDESFWKASAENNFTVPSAGSDVVIPIGRFFFFFFF